MTSALALLLGVTFPAQAATLPNLDFGLGRLTHWEGEGFFITTVTGREPSREFGVSSRDDGRSGRTGLLYRTFVVPPGAGAIRFTAAAVRAPGCQPGSTLDVILETTGRRVIPRQVRTARGLEVAGALQPLTQGGPREYFWAVSAYIGQTVRIAILDEDNRPGCHVLCSGFRILPADEFDSAEFVEHLRRLEREHRLTPLTRTRSKHFLAMSNTAGEYTEDRLYNCETIHALFFDHFRRQGFPVRQPAARMLVAIFDSQAGLEAYLGHPTAPTMTGVYHIPSNCLVVYDIGRNRAFLESRRRAEEAARQIPNDLARRHFLGTVNRRARDFRAGTNVGTMMHEVAHQLSFNCGLLNRKGDVPVWLSEGLACYCESTVNSNWQGIGEPNPLRAGSLADAAHGRGAFIPLRTLLANDDWLRKAPSVDRILLGYAQSWALFHLLMEERPRQLRRYLALVYDRPTPDHRLTDFAQAFGADLDRFEQRYQAHMRDLVREQARPGK
jgi:hypothetical protein